MFHPTLSKIARAAALATTMAVFVGGSGPALAAAPMAKVSAPGYFRLMLGNFEITALSDGTVDLPVDQLLMEPPGKTKRLLAAAFLAAPLETSVNAYLINTGKSLVLVDTGAAGLFGPTLGKLIANLKASGYEPAQIDEIYLTHLHPDHVGGLLADGVPAFPNAKVRADRQDSEFWLSQENMAKAPEAAKGFFQGAMNSLNPYVAAGKFLPFAGDTELLPGIKSSSAYGHTAGHTNYLIESDGKKLLLVGDLIHVAAVQFNHPAVTIVFDGAPKAAAAARAKAFTLAAKDATLVGAAHLQFPGLGHLRSVGKTYQWLPVNYTQMR
ncbi:MBL fold metallo-hydrolase [Rugamonas sp. CCM 8940]|uniref:MBL fold metallo-hydrolase n=1 Tax=Rugamonas sp. CCM 8940 TaxID=2765359 RepID=UPI0018F73897|nr:MBL fold metallo-hydrolase [Rugamonas sp. CCM 8940]MBJ7308747.1 MBL fold metallo-hydrolase [Rugamonas sp. CCM 8940]